MLRCPFSEVPAKLGQGHRSGNTGVKSDKYHVHVTYQSAEKADRLVIGFINNVFVHWPYSGTLGW